MAHLCIPHLHCIEVLIHQFITGLHLSVLLSPARQVAVLQEPCAASSDRSTSRLHVQLNPRPLADVRSQGI